MHNIQSISCKSNIYKSYLMLMGSLSSSNFISIFLHCTKSIKLYWLHLFDGFPKCTLNELLYQEYFYFRNKYPLHRIMQDIYSFSIRILGSTISNLAWRCVWVEHWSPAIHWLLIDCLINYPIDVSDCNIRSRSGHWPGSVT